MNNIDVLEFGYSFDSKSIKSQRSLDELRDDPMEAYLESETDLAIWTPVGEPGFNGNEVRLHGIRHFDKPNDSRDFALGSVRSWTVGFYDYHTGAGAWSDDMDLILDSGFDSDLIPELIAEPVPIENYEDAEGNYYAIFEFEAITEDDCKMMGTCDGWTLGGTYRIDTYPIEDSDNSDGEMSDESTITMSLELVAPKDFETDRTFGMMFGVSTVRDGESETESFLMYNAG